MPRTKIALAVLYGGQSNEREVSILSGREVMRGLPTNKYTISPIEISKKGEWILKEKRGKKIEIFDFDRKHSDLRKFDVIFIALHGDFGEDGTVQAILDSVGIRYTGSGVLASALGFDKAKAMEFVRDQGIKVPRFIFLTKEVSRTTESDLKKIGGLPCVIKPNRSGSSIGVSIVRKKNELAPALKRAFHEDNQILVEEYIRGAEFTCGVMGNSTQTELHALPPVEIIPREKFFNYKAKYFSKDTQEVCPAAIGKKLIATIQNTAKMAHHVLGCDGLTRSDFILKNNELYFLEINTLPGLTKNSLCPKEAVAVGMTFSEFLDRQVELALLKQIR